jgi:hypothetical protein
MDNFKIFYGYIVTLYEIEEIFHCEKYPEFWEWEDETETFKKLKNESIVFEMAKHEIMSKISHEDIKVKYFSPEIFSAENMLIVGIEIRRGCDEHPCIARIPSISDKVKYTMMNNLNIDLYVVGDSEPGIYCLFDGKK